MGSLTATPDPTTGVVRIDIEQTLLRDLFTRVVAGGWGNATSGQAWTLGGGVAGEYSVNGTQGLMTFSATGASRRMSAPVAVDADMGITAQCTISVLALTQPIVPCLMVRHTSGTSYYYMELNLNPVNPPSIRVKKMVLGVDSVIVDNVALAQDHAAGATWNLSMDVCGRTIRAKAWRSTVTEPDWIITATDSALLTGSNAGVRSFLTTGNTNGSVAFTWDNVAFWVGQPVRLYRVTPDGAQTEVRGSPGFTQPATAAADTATATFFDNEAPFDTVVTYILRSNCGTTTEFTSSPVTLLSNGNGWLRDPENASNNIMITFGNRAFDECTSTREVTLLTWQPRVRTNASGVFPIINSQRPNTVAMARKRYASAFELASKTLTDVDAIDTLLAPGTVLLASLPAAYGFGRPYNSDYITIGDVTEGQIVTDDYQNPFRGWEVPFELSYAPADTNAGGTGGNGIGAPGATYGDLRQSALGTTYLTLRTSGETYLQVAQGVGY